ncbi:MAG: 4'-phosphopantetheinyl transferase family protein [Terrimicrobiaceae bacterium]
MKEPAAAISWSNGLGEIPELETGACHLWELQPSHAYAALLGPRETERYHAVTNEEVKISFATSQGGLRTICAIYQKCHPSEIRLERAEHGKPFLAGGPHFNLSHTAGRIFAAFSPQPLGLDVESASRRVQARALAAKFFSPTEAARVCALDEAAAQAAFLRYWVGKEATVKLSGDGIFHGLRDARVELGEGGISHGEYRGRTVCLREFSPADGLLAALASWEPVEVKGFFRI